MKKFFASLLVFVVLTLLLVSCAPKSSTVEDCCEDVISLMNDMINSEEYIKIYNLPTEYDDTLTLLKSTDFSKPNAIYKLDISEISALTDEIDTEKLTDKLNEYIHSNMYTSIATLINQKSGMDAMAVSSIYTCTKSYICQSTKEDTAFLYSYENGCAIIVTILPGDSGSVRACGNLIINNDFNTDDAEQIEDYFAKIGIEGVVEKK